jgi:hypothetical protein
MSIRCESLLRAHVVHVITRLSCNHVCSSPLLVVHRPFLLLHWVSFVPILRMRSPGTLAMAVHPPPPPPPPPPRCSRAPARHVQHWQPQKETRHVYGARHLAARTSRLEIVCHLLRPYKVRRPLSEKDLRGGGGEMGREEEEDIKTPCRVAASCFWRFLSMLRHTRRSRCR